MPADEPPTRRATTSWILYDMANTIFSFNIVSSFYSLWLVRDLGIAETVFAVGNSVSMAVMLLLAPPLGALSDRTRRRIPFLVASTVACVTLTAVLGFVPWQASILLFMLANVGFQAGLIFYDSLLPTVSTPQTRGRIGALGVGIGYLGSLAGLGLGTWILSGNEARDPYLFVATAAFFLVLALPAFLFVRERAGPPLRLRLAELGTASRDSFRGLFRLLRGTENRDLRRFLVGRVFYTDAANTMIIFMAIYATQEIGFSDAGVRPILLFGILGAALGAPLWGILVDRAGPKHALDVVLSTWIFGLTVTVLVPVLGLPQSTFYPLAALLGAALGGTWSADRPLLLGLAPPERIGEFYGYYAMVGRFSAVMGPLAWALVADPDLLGWGRPAAVATLGVFMLAGFLILRRLPDPASPDHNPVGAYLPWRDERGIRQPLPRRWWARAPATLVYLTGTTLLFATFILRFGRDRANVPPLLFDAFAYQISALLTEVPRTLLNFVTSVWATHHPVQWVYVLVLLLFFGAWVEIREGSRRAMAIFYATSIGAGIFAGLLLHAIRLVSDAAWTQAAWDQAWTGGSAGAFGLMGVYAARARRPWLLLLGFVAWEVNVEWWYLRTYTPAFHLAALAMGFLYARYRLAPRAPGAPEAAGAEPGRHEGGPPGETAGLPGGKPS